MARVLAPRCCRSYLSLPMPAFLLNIPTRSERIQSSVFHAAYFLLIFGWTGHPELQSSQLAPHGRPHEWPTKNSRASEPQSLRNLINSSRTLMADTHPPAPSQQPQILVLHGHAAQGLTQPFGPQSWSRHLLHGRTLIRAGLGPITGRRSSATRLVAEVQISCGWMPTGTLLEHTPTLPLDMLAVGRL